MIPKVFLLGHFIYTRQQESHKAPMPSFDKTIKTKGSKCSNLRSLLFLLTKTLCFL